MANQGPYSFEGLGNLNPIPVPDNARPNPNADPLSAFAKPDVPQLVPPDFSGGTPDATPVTPIREQGQEDVNSAQAEDQYLNQAYNPKYNGPAAQGPTVLPGGARMANFGVNGQEGEANYRGATDPSQVVGGVNAESDAESQYGNQKAGILGRLQQDQAQEYAAIKDRQIQRQMELDNRQKAIDDATARYTSDLADRGQFWQKPGNVIAALATALMPLGNTSAKDAMKMIDSAVQTDWNQRRELADHHLGALKSNLTAYRQIAGDKDLGDSLALKHSYDVAQMELQRLAAQFQGPLAKAKAQQVAGQIQMQSSALAGEIANKVLANRPELMNPAQAAAYAKESKSGVAGAWNPLVPSAPTAGATGPAGPGMPVPGGGYSQPAKVPQLNDAMRQVSGGPTSVDKAIDSDPLFEARSPGTKSLVNMYKNQVAHEAMVSMGAHPDKFKFDQKVQEIKNADLAKASAVAEKASEKAADIKSWQRFSNDVNSVDAILKTTGEDPTKFLGDMRNLAPSAWATKVNKLRSAYASTDTPEARQFKANLDASERFHQVLADKLIGYYHKQGGARMSDAVQDVYGQVISPSSTWEQIKGFSKTQSQAAADDWKAMTATAGPRASTILSIRYGVNSPLLNTKGVPEKK